MFLYFLNCALSNVNQSCRTISSDSGNKSNANILLICLENAPSPADGSIIKSYLSILILSINFFANFVEV